MAQQETSVATLISTHILASSIISRHNTSNAILDENELATLRSFCADPGHKDAILARLDMVDELGQRSGTRAATVKRSLVGLIVARYCTGEPALTDGEIEELRAWFGRGGDSGMAVRG